MKNIILIMMLFVILLSSCAGDTINQNISSDANFTIDPGITRYIDKDADVVCWIYYAWKQGGISCLPLSSTKLKLSEQNTE